MKRRALIVAALSGSAATAALALRPQHRASEYLPVVDLDQQVPRFFANWRVDDTLIPVLPNPELQAKLDTVYTQTLARTYVDDLGRRVMLSIAYGADQGSDATAVHRPEFCYSAQGFSIINVGDIEIEIAGRSVMTRRLVARLSGRVEPITYWVTLNDSAALPGVDRKLRQIMIGLTGNIPDGMLFRISNIDPDVNAGFALHASFVSAMAEKMPENIKSRFFGRLAT